MVLSVNELRVSYPGRPPILGGLSLTVRDGEILSLLGPNGAGKTTLLRSLIGTSRPDSGTIRLAGQETWRLKAKALGRNIAYVPQIASASAPLRVTEVVLLGRTPHLSPFAMPDASDRRIAHDAMERLGILALKNERFTELSGGERQLVLLARALAQQARILLLDEPTANLDFGNQANILRVLRDLARDGLTIVMTTHFPDHALLLRSRVAVLCSGALVATGDATDVLTSELLSRIYRAPIRLTRIPSIDTPGEPIAVCVPIFHARSELGAAT